MAIRIYAAESISYRVAGMIEAQLTNHSGDLLKAVEEFAAECSIIKVYCSEMLNYAVDEGVQIHGGYGFHQDYAVERFYRDSRVNRIFEGTNEINRLLTTGMLLKRAQRGQLALVKAAKGVMDEILGGAPPDAGDEDLRLVHNARKITLLLLGVAYQKFLAEIEKQQEILAAISDAATEVFVMESVLLRSRKHPSPLADDYRAIYLRDALGRVETAARTVLAACSEGDSLRTYMAVLRRYAKHEPVDAIALRRRIAGRLLEGARYLA
jgi:hypothetical protein